MVIGAAIWNEHRISSLKENINNLVAENTMLSTSLESKQAEIAELKKLNASLLNLKTNNETTITEKTVFVNKVKDIKVTEAAQLIGLQLELDSKWENLQQ